MPDTIKQAMIMGLMRNEGMVDTMIEESLNGPVLDMQRMYRHAKRGNYVYGLPNAHVLNRNTGSDVIRQVLERIEGQAVTIEYSQFAQLNPIHVGWQHLVDEYDYDPATNEIPGLSKTKGATVYLEDIVAVYPLASSEDTEAGAVYSWGDNPRAGKTPTRPAMTQGLGGAITPAGYELDPDSPEKARIHIVWESGGLKRETLDVPMGDYPEDREFFQVKYITAEGKTKYWTYMDGDTTYPELNQVFNVNYTSPGTYFPFFMFRHHREDRTAEKYRGTQEYKDTEKLLSMIGVDYAELGAQIHENPDIEYVEQAVMLAAVPINATSQAERRYLHRFFSRLYRQTPRRSPSLSVASLSGNAIVWRDADYHTTLSFGEILQRVRPAKEGKVGTYTTRIRTETMTETYEHTTSMGETVRRVSRNYEYEVVSIRHQISETLVDEIQVINPRMRYDIWRGYAHEGSAGSGKVLIPVDYELAQELPLPVREQLYFRSLHLVFNSRVTQKVKWYERTFFKNLLIVAAVVITVFTLGKGAPLIAAAIKLGLYMLAAAMIFVMVGAFVLSTYAFRLVVKEIGVEAAVVIAVIALATGSAGSAFDLVPDATTYLNLSTSLMDATNYMLEQDLKAVMAEGEELSALKDQKMAELEQAMKLLETNDFLDPYQFIGQVPSVHIGESPDDFYNRTVHVGNIGTVIYKSVESYVDISLTLPTTHNTLGDTFL